LLKVLKHFEAPHEIIIKVRETALAALKMLACCFAELFYDPEDGGDTFLRNVAYHSTHYTASYPKRRYSSSIK
jgi:hypothetical protein